MNGEEMVRVGELIIDILDESELVSGEQLLVLKRIDFLIMQTLYGDQDE